jgi:hypothetical protein
VLQQRNREVAEHREAMRAGNTELLVAHTMAHDT